MKRVGLGCVLLLLACDPNAGFADYCALSGQCTCSGTDCCSVNVCGSDVGLDCCTGSVCLNGHCTADTAALSLSSNTLDLGRFPNVQTVPPQTITLTNTGVVTATNLGFTLKVSSGTASEFLVDFSACPSELAPGASCPVTVGLTPQTLGQKQATFTATGNVGNVLSYSTCNITGTVGELISIYIEPFVFSLAAQSSPAGLNCNEGCNFTGGSSAYFAAGTVLTITVTGLATGMAVSWTPPCNNLPGGGCTFTVSADAQLVGTAAPALTVELTTAGAQVTVVDPGGQSCSGGTCGFIESGPVTLTVQSPEPFVIEAWGGACSGTSQTCSLNVTLAATVTLSVSPPNNIFLTGPVALSTIGADGAGADTACHQAALGNRDTQPYVAWVATSTRNPASLLAAGSGWAISGTYPGDYILTARTIADITGPRLVSAIPPALGRAIATGANPDGTTLGMTETCQDWTSPSGTAPAGTSGGVGYAWSVDIGAPTLPVAPRRCSPASARVSSETLSCRPLPRPSPSPSLPRLGFQRAA